tara:strand:- start:1805 stop:2062 length:258 start_codon:yes stop_codon:yes gene_type:complete
MSPLPNFTNMGDMWATVNWFEVFFTTIFFLLIQRYIWNRHLERHLDKIEGIMRFGNNRKRKEIDLDLNKYIDSLERAKEKRKSNQ